MSTMRMHTHKSAWIPVRHIDWWIAAIMWFSCPAPIPPLHREIMCPTNHLAPSQDKYRQPNQSVSQPVDQHTPSNHGCVRVHQLVDGSNSPQKTCVGVWVGVGVGGNALMLTPTRTTNCKHKL
mmetsp:Transcript_14717/g.40697  ORF Transcript_14717/g.40697 Transcript_14717/m.40697 type:complete len:123 (+) Transcript_14717:1244-1612(+)